MGPIQSLSLAGDTNKQTRNRQAVQTASAQHTDKSLSGPRGDWEPLQLWSGSAWHEAGACNWHRMAMWTASRDDRSSGKGSKGALSLGGRVEGGSFLREVTSGWILKTEQVRGRRQGAELEDAGGAGLGLTCDRRQTGQ